MKKKFSNVLLALITASLIVQPHYVFAEETPTENPLAIEENTILETTSSTPEITEPVEQENTETITEPLPTIEAKLRIETASGGTLFSQTLTVSACKPYDTATEYTLNAKCLVDQAQGITSTWNYFGTDAFLNSVNDYSNDFGANVFWGYFINLEYGSVALNAYTLQEGDEVLLVYDVNPLKIEVDTTEPILNTTTTVHIYEFGLDENWNPVWKPAASTTLYINEEANSVTGTDFTFTITTTTPYILRAEKEKFASYEKTVNPKEIIPTDTTNTTHNGSSGNGNSCCNSKTGVAGMMQFLDAKQNTDGSFGASAFLNDWTAIAYGAWNGTETGKSKLTAYLLSDPNPLDGPNKTTNYARRAMGLMSLGINPYTGTKTNYIQTLLSEFDGTQFGDTGLINDDIFALIPLVRAGYTSEDALVVSTTKFVITHQNTNGSFGSIDLTAAGIEALQPLESINGVADALTKAKAYLHAAQSNDGGFENVYATSWAMQAISALTEDQTNWTVNAHTPLSYLTEKQALDGGLLENDIMSNRIWATAYAVPAILGKSWNAILSPFDKPNTNSNTTSGSNTESDSTSSTPKTVTTTPEIITTPTSTPTSTVIATPLPETETSIKEPLLYARTIETTAEAEHPSVRKPETLVLGEKEVNTSTDPAENIQASNENTASTENPQTKKYLFITSLAIFLTLVGYMAFKPKS